MRKLKTLAVLALLASFEMPLLAAQPRANADASAPAQADLKPLPPLPAGDNDQTLHAMHDELERSRTRLKLPGVDKPFYIEYRLLDVDVRSVNASFGALLSSDVSRNRFMSVDVRVGDYHLDSSNFVSEDGFRGFLGSTGQVGIDRDYNSLRQDLWLATDQAYKAAVTQMSLKQAFLRSLTKAPEIDDFSQAPPMVKVDPRLEPDWTSRNWENEARTASAVLKEFRATSTAIARELLPGLRHLVPDDERRHDHPHVARAWRPLKARWTRMPKTAWLCTIITPLTPASPRTCPMRRPSAKGWRRPARN